MLDDKIFRAFNILVNPSRVEVRTLCIPFKYLYAKPLKPRLYETDPVSRGMGNSGANKDHPQTVDTWLEMHNCIKCLLYAVALTVRFPGSRARTCILHLFHFYSYCSVVLLCIAHVHTVTDPRPNTIPPLLYLL